MPGKWVQAADGSATDDPSVLFDEASPGIYTSSAQIPSVVLVFGTTNFAETSSGWDGRTKQQLDVLFC